MTPSFVSADQGASVSVFAVRRGKVLMQFDIKKSDDDAAALKPNRRLKNLDNEGPFKSRLEQKAYEGLGRTDTTNKEDWCWLISKKSATTSKGISLSNEDSGGGGGGGVAV